MKKRAVKAKRTVKPPAAKKAGAKTSKPAVKAAAKTAVTTIAKATPYTPAPLKGDGWPPFRYPVT